jgi:hypothetical protein
MADGRPFEDLRVDVWRWVHNPWDEDNPGESESWPISYAPERQWWTICKRDAKQGGSLWGSAEESVNSYSTRVMGGGCTSDTDLTVPCEGTRSLVYGPALILNDGNRAPEGCDPEVSHQTDDYTSRAASTCTGAKLPILEVHHWSVGNTSDAAKAREEKVAQAIRCNDQDLQTRIYAWAGGRRAPNSMAQQLDLQDDNTRRKLNKEYFEGPQVHCASEECVLEIVGQSEDPVGGGFDYSHNLVVSTQVGTAQVVVCIRATFECRKKRGTGDGPPDLPGAATSKIPISRFSPIYYASKMDLVFRTYDDYVRAVRMCKERVAIWGGQVRIPYVEGVSDRGAIGPGFGRASLVEWVRSSEPRPHIPPRDTSRGRINWKGLQRVDGFTVRKPECGCTGGGPRCECHGRLTSALSGAVRTIETRIAWAARSTDVAQHEAPFWSDARVFNALIQPTSSTLEERMAAAIERGVLGWRPHPAREAGERHRR